MKLIKLTYSDGSIAYASPSVNGKYNKEEPITTEEVDATNDILEILGEQISPQPIRTEKPPTPPKL